MKVKERSLKNQQRDFELDMSFAEWLDYFSKKPTSKEIDEMEKQSSNNPNYQPLKGA
jgi:hypothetical protein